MQFKQLIFFLIFFSLLAGCIKAQNVDSIDFKKKSILPLPLITRSIETDWSFGAVGVFTFPLSKKDNVARTSNFELVGLYSLKKQLVTGINGNLYFPKEKYILNFLSSYSSFPDKFWGIGNNSANSSEKYSFEQYYIFGHLMRSLGNNLFMGGAIEFQHLMKINYLQGGLFDIENIAGRNGYKSSALALSFTHDNRNHAFTPNKGFFFQTFLYNYNKVFGSTFNFTSLSIDVRKYLQILPQQILAFQLLTLQNFGNQIPLRNLATLGGAGNMRGYYAGRFRDNDNFLLQGEYRIDIYKRWGGTLFGSVGNVGKNYTDIFSNTFKYAYGGGIRFALNKTERLNLRIDYGIGAKGNSGLYFQIGEAF